jgi:hypothetical protein
VKADVLKDAKAWGRWLKEIFDEAEGRRAVEKVLSAAAIFPTPRLRTSGSFASG